MSRNPASVAYKAATPLLLACVLAFVGCGGSEQGQEGELGEAGASPPATTTVTSTPGQPEETPTPAPTATSTPQPEETPATERPPKPETSAGADRGPGSDDEVEQPETNPNAGPRTTKGSAGGSAGSSAGEEYTWHDGDRMEYVNLESDLVVQASSENTEDDIVTRDDGETSVVQKQPRHTESDTDPVFRSQGGTLMTLPGGVLLTLDPDWDTERVNRFFADNDIASSNVEEQNWADNAFFIRTDPGFPSLNLANELAVQEGVEISSPNWQTEVSLR